MSERYVAPLCVSHPVYNEQGFSRGFKVYHPPGVEHAYHPETKRCSCGRPEDADPIEPVEQTLF
jgi:hypothetical protein